MWPALILAIWRLIKKPAPAQASTRTRTWLKCLLWFTEHRESSVSRLCSTWLGCCFHLNWNQIKVFSLTKWNCALGFVFVFVTFVNAINVFSLPAPDCQSISQLIFWGFVGCVCVLGSVCLMTSYCLAEGKGFVAILHSICLPLLWLIVSSIIYAKFVFPFAE